MLRFSSRHITLGLTSTALFLSCGEDPAPSDTDGMNTAITTPTASAGATSSTTATTTTTASNPSTTPTGMASSAVTTGGTTTTRPDVTPPMTSSTPSATTAPSATMPMPMPSVTASSTSTAEDPPPAMSTDDMTDPPPMGSGGANDVDPPEMPDVDVNGKGNATPGSMTDVPQDYLKLGEMRILNNNWGSEDLGCTAPNSTMSVFVNPDGAFGWNFNRGDCAQPTDTSHPDFPQLEFGIHPFGIGSDLATSPEFSSTTLLPLQIKDITSAKVTLDNFNIALQNQDSWNIAMEFWLSERDPVNDPNPAVHTELMTWWGWDNGRWPCDLNGDGMVEYGDRVSAGTLDYTVCHQSDNWASGWRYYQMRAGDGSDGNIKTNFTGVVDVKALLDYLVNSRGYSTELWLTRMEVGSEIDDNTSGTVSMRGATFEVNGESRSQVLGMP